MGLTASKKLYLSGKKKLVLMVKHGSKGNMSLLQMTNTIHKLEFNYKLWYKSVKDYLISNHVWSFR